jgi:hypothetical protein
VERFCYAARGGSLVGGHVDILAGVLWTSFWNGTVQGAGTSFLNEICEIHPRNVSQMGVIGEPINTMKIQSQNLPVLTIYKSFPRARIFFNEIGKDSPDGKTQFSVRQILLHEIIP